MYNYYIMGKNFKGGKKHKKGAKKNAASFNKAKLRLVREEGEIYARVTTVFGNGMAEVLCNDDVKRLLIIRRRFKGRNKRDNNIAVDVMVLVGLRLWEVVAAKKKQKVDLLYVYSKEDISELKDLPEINKKILPGFVKIDEEDMPFEMSNSHGDEYSDGDKINEIVETTNSKISMDLDFDFDDI